MPFGIFRVPNLSAANIVAALLGAAWIPMRCFLNLCLQEVLGYGASEAGAAPLPMTAAIMVLMVGVTGRAVARFGVARVSVAGLAILAAGIGWMSLVPADGSFLSDVLPAALVAAVGMSLAYIPVMMAAQSGAAPQEATYQVGSALGVAPRPDDGALHPAVRPVGDEHRVSRAVGALFIVMASSGLVALAFTGQATELGRPFWALALLPLPALLVLGTLTYLRLEQSAIDDLEFPAPTAGSHPLLRRSSPRAGRWEGLRSPGSPAGAHVATACTPTPRPWCRWSTASSRAGIAVSIAGTAGFPLAPRRRSAPRPPSSPPGVRRPPGARLERRDGRRVHGGRGDAI